MKMDSFSSFVIENENADTDKLLLSKSQRSGIDMVLAVNTIVGRRRMKAKAPSWYACHEVIYPNRLCTEQCSSERTAEIKAEAILECCGFAGAERGGAEGGATDGAEGAEGAGRRARLADLTGGLGVDSSVFARRAEALLYNEANGQLAEAARHNFAALGLDTIEVHNEMIVNGGEDFIAAFRPDIIYLDPARRTADGRKVFLLEDCQPDILRIKDALLAAARFVAVKLSPMADISMVIERLGRQCRRLEVISSENECKELVAILDREYDGECVIAANCGGRAKFEFTLAEEAAASHPELGSGSDGRFRNKFGMTQEEGGMALTDPFLLEPDKALMKAAPFKLLGRRLGLVKADVSTHYYFGMTQREGLFKVYRILQILPLDKRSIKAVAAEYPAAEVTARNIPMSSDELRKRLKVRASDQYHIFGLKISGENCLVVTMRS